MPRIRRNNAAVSFSWKIALYIRLSREDCKNDDMSGSVKEQKKILLEYLNSYFADEYTVVDYYIDDGLTGTTDDTRDEFQRMMDDVEYGKVNCIIVKTLSRAFRNYADQGRYLEQIFPSKGIRFISIGNPFVDSFKDPDAIQNGMEIPINGLMNDRYAAKTSADVRRTLDSKRRRGEFIGAFAPYGYIKDPDNKNKLIVDVEAAQIVRDIFFWFVNEGMSKISIAKKLNGLGVPSPSAYKNQVQRLSYKNPHNDKNDGLWGPSIILNILQNEVYIGNMVQGRSRVISYKVHKQVKVAQNNWFVVPDTHEAIIDKETFYKAQELHSRDMRTAPGKRELYIFSGYISCADCKKNMRRKPSKGYVYYSCRTKTDKGSCTKRSIREDKLARAVLDALKIQISLIGSYAYIEEAIKLDIMKQTQAARLKTMLNIRDEELQKIIAAIDNLYLDWKSRDITRDDYLRMRVKFDDKKNKLQQDIVCIKDEITAISNEENCEKSHIDEFLQHKNISKLDRGLVTLLIDMIYVHDDGSLTIDFAFADELRTPEQQ